MFHISTICPLFSVYSLIIHIYSPNSVSPFALFIFPSRNCLWLLRLVWLQQSLSIHAALPKTNIYIQISNPLLNNSVKQVHLRPGFPTNLTYLSYPYPVYLYMHTNSRQSSITNVWLLKWFRKADAFHDHSFNLI